MSEEPTLEIGFTQVLYGVVVSSAIFDLQFDITIRNFMLLLALAFILGDWIEYQIGIQEASETMVNYVLAFVIDVVILIEWYLITIIPVADLKWFFGMAGTFFVLQAMWDRLILDVGLGALIRKPHLTLALFFIGLAGIQIYTNLSPWLLLMIATVVFIGRKSLRWRELISKSPEAL